MNAEVTLVSTDEVKSRGGTSFFDKAKAVGDSIRRGAVERWTEAVQEFNYRFELAKMPRVSETGDGSARVRVLAGFCVAPTGAVIPLFEGRNEVAILSATAGSAQLELTIHGSVAFITQKGGAAETVPANRVLLVGTQKVLVKILPERCRMEQSETLFNNRGNL